LIYYFQNTSGRAKEVGARKKIMCNVKMFAAANFVFE